ncbi:MAG TPA: hypothetical protein VKU80_13310 [Planctomycetota bacterium]|nr:hypothetical protein [Planctomycetota bacterium]
MSGRPKAKRGDRGKEARRGRVLFLGAGFSKGLGLPDTRDLWDLGLKISTAAKNWLLLEDAYKSYPLAAFVERGVKDVEILLSFWHEWVDFIYRAFPDTNGFPRAYLEDYTRNLAMHLDEASREVQKSGMLANFSKWLARAAGAKAGLTVVTTNYDCLVEFAAAAAELKYDYLDDSSEKLPIAKLHGSVNWALFSSQVRRWSDGWKPRLLNEHEGIGVYDCELEPIPWVAQKGVPALIPPIIRKEYDGIFKEVIRLAARSLNGADRVLMIGYAFPEADIVVEGMLKAILGRSRNPPEVLYVNPDERAVVRAKKILEATANVTYASEKWSVDHLNWLTR